ncbi:Cd209a [Phodopus roborovskii]|uniref:Cd209a protein n=1 Tax=Phodopus roborovskii TaxID=109678 RepID=A0AAV0A7G1_PHORO|nr:Cd209a [Phodopus roborovskii]
MSNSKEMGRKQLGPLDEEQLISSHTRYSTKGFGFQPNSALSSFAGHLGLSHVPLALQILFLTVFSVLLVVILAKDRLCLPCPWEWMPFQGSCYFFSVIQKTWNDSATACQKVGAQLVVIKSDEEQSTKKRGNTWMGLIDLNKESTWHWVDGSPLTLSQDVGGAGDPGNGHGCAVKE